jgi:hypothetical protein
MSQNLKSSTRLVRTIHPEIRVLDAAKGLVEYVASDETVDSYREIIRADGWRFDLFKKNAPFVDSHDYSTLEKLLGNVVDFKVAGKKLVETVQWAVDVTDNKLAQLGWKMTAAGYLKAVSVGFYPVRMATRWDSDQSGYLSELTSLNLAPESGVRAIYQEQQQIELSACIIGANPNALAKSYKAGVLDDADLEFLSIETAKRETDNAATDPADAAKSRQRARTAFLVELQTKIKSL